LTIGGDWKSLKEAGYEYFAPGSLKAANSMEAPNAVSMKKMQITPNANSVTITVESLSAGVLNLTKGN
jgi:alpha-L-arabinofuranosidase